jgi:hypothetical protein
MWSTAHVQAAAITPGVITIWYASGSSWKKLRPGPWTGQPGIGSTTRHEENRSRPGRHPDWAFDVGRNRDEDERAILMKLAIVVRMVRATCGVPPLNSAVA